MTNKARNRGHTVFDNVAMIKDLYKQCVKMNPVDAAARGIKEGDMVYVYNDRGCTKIPANVTNVILPGVISVEHGAWYRKDPEETVASWQDYKETGVYEKIQMPVDIGGAENMLTDDHFTHEPLFLDTALAAQGGPCEVSKTKPIY
jgi:anaerobic dimethyl sulfoxide reductase subunit A